MNAVDEFYAMFLFVKEICRTSKNVHDHLILGVTGSMGPVTY